MSGISPSLIFKTAAVLNALSVVGHVYMGFDAVYPALKKIPLVGKHASGQRGAENCWNYVAASMWVAACLNWQWARTGGPQTLEENVIFWTIAAIQAVNGFRYGQVGEYGATGAMWLGPLLGMFAKRSLQTT